MCLERARNQGYTFYFTWGLHDSQSVKSRRQMTWSSFGQQVPRYISSGFFIFWEEVSNQSEAAEYLWTYQTKNSVVIQWSSQPFLQAAVFESRKNLSFEPKVCPKGWKLWEVLGTGFNVPKEVGVSLFLIYNYWVPGALMGWGLLGYQKLTFSHKATKQG